VEGAIERPDSFAELQSRLGRLSREYEDKLGMSFTVDLVREGGGRLSVGLGEHQWMLSYSPEDDGPALNSLGDAGADGHVVFHFGQYTRLSRKYLVPRRSALEAVKAFWEHGALSQAIEWTEEIFDVD
jgi:hypothetical protein